MSVEQIAIELVYGLPKQQTLLSLQIDAQSTVEQAIAESGICQKYEEIDLAINKVGIWNRAVKLGQIVEDGDRIEIYRPLIADPKEVRKRRAEKAKEEGRADLVTGGRVNPQRSKTKD
ncbi:RnfH family protein [Thalassotalea nanhaiensis]|uniref:UPF0125 protein RI845_06045 n=1 Tax=Thalassotalea nanhaiensis TaxID=3065648 RepID=A0ABY9TLW3_9GAMM|nr:RnfH family protein [Colwelliaceae bacterium SQ345]